MTKPYVIPKLRSSEKLTKSTKLLIEDLIKSITGQIRVFEGKNTEPGAIYGISRCLRMIHEHFESGFTQEAREYLNRLNIDDTLAKKETLTIREVYRLNRKIDKSERMLLVEHTDGGIKKMAIDLLGCYKHLNKSKEDFRTVQSYVENNTYFIIKHKELNKNINEEFSIK